MDYLSYIDEQLDNYRKSDIWNIKVINTPHKDIIQNLTLHIFKIETLSFFEDYLETQKCSCGKKCKFISYNNTTRDLIIKKILKDNYPDITKEISLKNILILFFEYHKICNVNFLCKQCILSKKKESLKTYTINDKNYKVTKVDPDGHCFFSCLSIMLNKSIFDLRNEVSNYMINYKEDFINSYEPDENNNDSYEEFVENIRNTNEWADHIVIQAAQMSLRQPIEIYYEENSNLIITRDVTINSEIKPILLLFNGTNHYDLLENVDFIQKYSEDELELLTVKELKIVLSNKNIVYDKKDKKNMLIKKYLDST